MASPADGSLAAVRAAGDELARQVRHTLAQAGRAKASGYSIGPLTEELAAARKRAGLSFDALAQRSGVAKSHLWELEHGKAGEPSIRVLAAVAKATGVPLMRLVWAVVGSAEMNGELRDA